MLDKFFAIGLSLLILGQVFLLRRYVGTLIFPACIFGLFWFGFTFFPLVLLFSVPIEPLAVAYILVACLIFSGTALFFRWEQTSYSKKMLYLTAAYESNFLKCVFYCMSSIVVIATIANWALQQISLHDIVFNFFQTGNEYLKRKYDGNISSNVFSKMSLLLIYPVAILGGILYSGRKRWRARVPLIVGAFAAPLLAMAVEGNKGAFFLAASLFWGGILVGRLGKNENLILIRDDLIAIVTGLVVLVPILISAFWIRMIERISNFDEALVSMLWYFYSYTCAHLYAFSDWFSSLIGHEAKMAYQNDLGSNGFYTFMAFFRVLGDDREIVHGVFSEYFFHENVMQSNIYTIFRGLITDFGLYAALLFWCVVGLFVHAFFYSLLCGRRQALSISVFVHFVGFAYSSFIVSFLMWNSIYASVAITAGILQLNRWINRNRLGALA